MPGSSGKSDSGIVDSVSVPVINGLANDSKPDSPLSVPSSPAALQALADSDDELA